MYNLNNAIFQCMRHDIILSFEKRNTKTLRYKARMRERDASLKAYLDLISETVISLKQNRTFYY
jgi:hypothetical protein